ncbi:Eukaryotic translation elongation factor 1 epsilon-1, partial [Papilio machaon]
QVLTTVLDKENVEGFASIVLRLAAKSGTAMTQEQVLLSYQWLEHIAMYGNQALSNPTFAKNFLQGINRALAKNTYLTGQFLTVVDIAAYHALYPLIERLSFVEQELFMNVCRWSKHIQAQPRVLFTVESRFGFHPDSRRVVVVVFNNFYKKIVVLFRFWCFKNKVKIEILSEFFLLF